MSCVVLAAVDITLVYLPALGAERGIAAGTVGLLLTLRATASMTSRLLPRPPRRVDGAPPAAARQPRALRDQPRAHPRADAAVAARGRGRARRPRPRRRPAADHVLARRDHPARPARPRHVAAPDRQPARTGARAERSRPARRRRRRERGPRPAPRPAWPRSGSPPVGSTPTPDLSATSTLCRRSTTDEHLPRRVPHAGPRHRRPRRRVRRATRVLRHPAALVRRSACLRGAGGDRALPPGQRAAEGRASASRATARCSSWTAAARCTPPWSGT